MGLVSQTLALREMEAIQGDATRALQGFTNAFDATFARLAAFETDVLPTAGFDAPTLAEVAGAKQAIISQAIAAVTARLAQLQTL